MDAKDKTIIWLGTEDFEWVQRRRTKKEFWPEAEVMLDESLVPGQRYRESGNVLVEEFFESPTWREEP